MYFMAIYLFKFNYFIIGCLQLGFSFYSVNSYEGQREPNVPSTYPFHSIANHLK